MQVIWSPQSLREAALIFDYLTFFNPHAAAEVFTALIEAGDNLETFPHRGRPIPNTSMREITTSYPYIIRYRVTQNTVHILRIRHTSRRPTVP